jgi:hypothetical protein
MKFYLFIFFQFLVFYNNFAATKNEEIEQFEVRNYRPQLAGVKDLVFEIKVDGLKEILEKTMAINRRADIYYKVYWMEPDQFRIVVMGLPKGYESAEKDLRALIKEKLEFVLPEKFSTKFDSYTLKEESLPDGKLIKALDETYTLPVTQMNIFFDKSEKLKSIDSFESKGKISTEYFYSPKNFSANKLVLDKVVSTIGVAGNMNKITHELDYFSINGIGFPENLKIKIATEYSILPTQKEKSKIIKKENTTLIHFSKYEVNSGKAQRFIKEGLLR